MIPVIIVEHIKNKKTVMDAYAIKKLLEIIENISIGIRESKSCQQRAGICKF